MSELQTIRAKREFYKQGGINRLAEQIFDSSAAIIEPCENCSHEHTIDCRLRYHDGEWFFLVGPPGYDLDHKGHWGCYGIGCGVTAGEARDIAYDLFEQVMDTIAEHAIAELQD